MTGLKIPQRIKPAKIWGIFIAALNCAACSALRPCSLAAPRNWLRAGRNRFRLGGRQTREVAITVASQARGIVPFVFGIRQCLCLGVRQLRVVASLPAVFASGKVALALGEDGLGSFGSSEFRAIAIVRAPLTILRVAQMFGDGNLPVLPRD